MAFVRHPSLGLSTRFLLSRTIGTPSVALVSLRHLSTSRPTLQAQPVHHDPASHGKSPRLETGVYSARDEQDKYVNPYKGGPSALEKAAHLFFFTEIVRGSSTIVAYVVSTVSENAIIPRHVAGLGAILSSTIHNHVPLREGSPLPSLPRRARASPLSQRRRAVHWFVRPLSTYSLKVDLDHFSMQVMRGDLPRPGYYN